MSELRTVSNNTCIYYEPTYWPPSVLKRFVAARKGICLPASFRMAGRSCLVKDIADVQNGILNPAHSLENVQLMRISVIHSNSQSSLPFHTDSISTSADPQRKSSKDSRQNSGSEVFGVCCSSSGHVPFSGAKEKADTSACDVGDDDDSGNEENRSKHTALERQLGIEYSVTDFPSIHMCFIFGLQQVLLSISSTISIPLIVSRYICAEELTLVKSEIMSTFLFMCGICTILQILIGVRLPIIQGGCHKFVPAIAALMALDKWKCPAEMEHLVHSYNNGSTENLTEIWQSRMREIQGGIMLASLAQVLIGCTGLLGLLLDYLGPMTVVPTISLVGLSLIDVALNFCQKHWGITALTVGLVFLFSLYLRNVKVPFPTFNRKKGCRVFKYPVFKLLPVILAVVLAWSFCAVLTATGTLTQEGVRTDSKQEVLQLSSWFFFPYPAQWGVPTVSLASFMAMLAATITSIIESVGDYYACARISGVPPPPAHAVNRGIAIEGLGSLISGAVGSGGATTSYSQNVGAIGFTKVASRWAFVGAGVIFLLSGLIGKFGALLTMVPDPVLGGIVLVSFGMVTAVGLSTLSFVDLSSGRNLTIIGSSMIVGLMIPRYLTSHPDAIDTGNKELDQVLQVILGTAMFVGGVLAFFLDNTVPGTPEERGIIKWRKLAELTAESSTGDNPADVSEADYIRKIYGFPCLSSCLRKMSCCRYVPFMPTFAFKRISPFKWLCAKFRKNT